MYQPQGLRATEGRQSEAVFWRQREDLGLGFRVKGLRNKSLGFWVYR